MMAGIYYGMIGKEVNLTGYLRCGGNLSVLGLVSVTVEFYLGLTYRKKENNHVEVWGQATLTVGVKVAFLVRASASLLNAGSQEQQGIQPLHKLWALNMKVTIPMNGKNIAWHLHRNNLFVNYIQSIKITYKGVFYGYNSKYILDCSAQWNNKE
ncbi:hypothetical protein AAHB57_28725 [Bacillus cereus]